MKRPCFRVSLETAMAWIEIGDRYVSLGELTPKGLRELVSFDQVLKHAAQHELTRLARKGDKATRRQVA